MSIRRDLEQIAELAPRVAIYFTAKDPAGQTAWDRINLAMTGHPKAAQWDLERVSGTPWCWTHQQDLRDCHEAAWGCLADDQISGPSDPTGEAALHGDRAADIERQCYDDVKALLRILQRLEDNGSKFPPTRPANAYERSQTATENDPHCESCCRIEIAKGIAWWVEPRTKERSTVGKRLEQPTWLCDWCENHVIQTGIVPSEDEVEQHRAGKRVRCPHPKVEQEDAA